MRRAVLTLLALVLALPVAAQTSGTLTPMQRRGEILGWEAVGRINTPKGMCTGVLIAPDVALTAAHCVYEAHGARIPARDIVFRAGYHRGTSMADRRGAALFPHRAYKHDVSGRVSGAMMAYDVALLRLDAPINSAEADPFKLFNGDMGNLPVSVVSYGQDRAEYLSRQAECAVLRRYRNGQIAFDCNVTYGSSGAPVFARQDGRIRIVSLISAMATEQDGDRLGESYGMALPGVVAQLMGEMRRDNARPKASAGARRVSVGQRMTSGGARFVRP
ncbi:trypsin-like serine peptidase [Thalassococcus sp. BH17M4-6]|uniref:trypsin-like serine peptidase n=1 Tax=Thalassococcus sp. BH17M4-6 TaxID=3413148 RepID=UPI003BE79C12